VHFVGTPPIIPGQAPLPPWAHEFDGSRKVVLVTQGTVANHNFELLIARRWPRLPTSLTC
jgi:hypothetical protein